MSKYVRALAKLSLRRPVIDYKSDRSIHSHTLMYIEYLRQCREFPKIICLARPSRLGDV